MSGSPTIFVITADGKRHQLDLADHVDQVTFAAVWGEHAGRHVPVLRMETVSDGVDIEDPLAALLA